MQLQVPATDIMHLTQAQAHIHSHTHETVSIKTRRVWEAFVAQLNSIELSWVERKKRIGIWQLAASGSRPPCNWWIVKRFAVNARAIIYLRLWRYSAACALLLFLPETHWLLSLGVIVVAAGAFRSIATMIAITRKQHALAVPQIHLKYLKLPLQQRRNEAHIWRFCKVQRNAAGMRVELPQSARNYCIYLYTGAFTNLIAKFVGMCVCVRGRSLTNGVCIPKVISRQQLLRRAASSGAY